MVEKNFWKQVIQKKLSEQNNLMDKYRHFDFKLYLFGSALSKQFPHDLDIMITYPYSSMLEARAVRDETASILRETFLLPVDVILMSYEEEQQACFLTQEHAELVLP